MAGVVEALGDGVQGFAVGDEVLGQVADGDAGGIAEYAVLSAHWTAHKPAEVSFVQAAALPIFAATAYESVRQLGLAKGETLVVVGAGGGVGIAVVQLARNDGVDVIGTANTTKRVFVEAADVPAGPGAADRVRQAAPNGVDALFDLVGGQALSDLAPLVGDKARIISGADSKTVAELGGSSIKRARTAKVLSEIVGLVRDGVLDPFVTAVLPLGQAGVAMRLVEFGHATGKVAIEVG